MLTVLLLSGCITSENQIKIALEKNPKILFDVIEKNPEEFLTVVNRTAEIAQRRQYEKRFEESKKQIEADLQNPKKPKYDKSRILFGQPTSKIVIVKYSDMQCPACQMAYKNIEILKDKYKDHVQFIFKHMPLDFHPMAYPAAQYFEALMIQNKKMAQKFYTLVFENQKKLSPEFLKNTAQKLGADMKKLNESIKSEKLNQLIESDIQEFQNFGYSGTPVILINGVALHGAQPVAEMERIIDLTLK